MKKKVFYGWWIVLATNLICLLGYGTWLYSFGVFFKPMAAEFGWTRAMTAGAYSLRSIEGGIASPIVGWAVDKYGSRRVIIFGGLVSGLGFAMMPFVNSLLGFYLAYGIVVSIGMSAMLYLPAFTVIAKWFTRKLSRALAVLSLGAGLGGLICAPVAAVVINQFGWRAAFLGMGVLMLMGHPLNLLQFGEEQARQLGLNVSLAKTIIIIAASITTAVAVSFSGIIGFIGLVVPHIVRMIWGPDYRKLIPLSVFLGSATLLAADVLARWVMAPRVLPVGIVTAMIGAPFFLWILRRAKAEVFW